jgi:hypothetical protein
MKHIRSIYEAFSHSFSTASNGTIRRTQLRYCMERNSFFKVVNGGNCGIATHNEHKFMVSSADPYFSRFNILQIVGILNVSTVE